MLSVKETRVMWLYWLIHRPSMICSFAWQRYAACIDTKLCWLHWVHVLLWKAQVIPNKSISIYFRFYEEQRTIDILFFLNAIIMWVSHIKGMDAQPCLWEFCGFCFEVVSLLYFSFTIIKKVNANVVCASTTSWAMVGMFRFMIIYDSVFHTQNTCG